MRAKLSGIGLVALTEEAPEPRYPFTMQRHNKKMVVPEPENGPSPDTEPGGALILGLLSPELSACCF